MIQFDVHSFQMGGGENTTRFPNGTQSFPDSRYALVVPSAYEMTLPKFSAIERVIQCWDSYYHHLLEAYDHTKVTSREGQKDLPTPQSTSRFVCVHTNMLYHFSHILTHQTIRFMFFFLGSPHQQCIHVQMHICTYLFNIYIYIILYLLVNYVSIFDTQYPSLPS